MNKDLLNFIFTMLIFFAVGAGVGGVIAFAVYFVDCRRKLPRERRTVNRYGKLVLNCAIVATIGIPVFRIIEMDRSEHVSSWTESPFESSRQR